MSAQFRQGQAGQFGKAGDTLVTMAMVIFRSDPQNAEKSGIGLPRRLLARTCGASTVEHPDSKGRQVF
jgi:hypothetical protein